VKSVGVFIIIISCFTVLYPKIFHPVVMHMFGFKSESPDNEAMLNRIPPHLRRSMSQSMRAHEEASHDRMRAPHPGLRAAAEMKKQAVPPSGMGGKGLMSVVLPLYAIGIVVYLVYTLSKVFGKSNDSMTPDYLGDNNPFSSAGHEIEKLKGTSYTNDKYEYGKNKNDDFERLLLRADERKITDDELLLLKKRLMDTETQMSRILQAMSHVQTNVESLGEVIAPEKNGVNRNEELGAPSSSFARSEGNVLRDIKSKRDISHHCENLMSRIEDLGVEVDLTDNKSNNDNAELNVKEQLVEKIADTKEMSDDDSFEQYSENDITTDDCDSTSVESFSNSMELENKTMNNRKISNDLRKRKTNIAAT